MPIFKRNLEKIKAVGTGSTRQGRIDITASFRTYLQEEIDALFSEIKKNGSTFNINRDNLMALTRRALIRAFSSKDENYKKDTAEEQILHSYQELAGVVDNMSDNDPFVEEVFNLYFGTALDNLIEQTGKKNKRTTSAKQVSSMISNAKGIHGNLQEYMLALVNNVLPKEKEVGKMVLSGTSG